MLDGLQKEYKARAVVICSRRTPEGLLEWLRNEWIGRFWAFGDPAPNPYNEALLQGNVFVVTSDSISMICDAIGTGGKVYITAFNGSHRNYSYSTSKFNRFHKDVIERGYCKYWSGKCDTETEEFPDLGCRPSDTVEVARKIWSRYVKQIA